MKSFLILASFFLFAGVILTSLGFVGWLYLPLLMSIFFILCFVSVIFGAREFLKVVRLSVSEQLLFSILLVVWFIHFLQVLVPETGFDALWYHLPVIQAIQSAQGLVFQPELYQSVNPLFADLYFLTGYSVFGAVGAKLVAYFFAVLCITATYHIARTLVSRQFALLTVICVSLFQVIAWQSASFYVDVAKAFFELSGLLFLFHFVKRKSTLFLYLAVLFFSASLATKLFSILLVPFFSYAIWEVHKTSTLKKNFKPWGTVIVASLLLLSLPLLYYLRAQHFTGSAFYSIFVHIDKLQEIGGSGSALDYIVQRILFFPLSFVQITAVRDYVFPGLGLLLSVVLFQSKQFLKNIYTKLLLIFSLFQWMIWWFVPPLSTRYALSGFITLFILGVFVLHDFFQKHKRTNLLRLLLLMVACILLLPRLVVAHRSLKYILTPQTTAEYLQQFSDGSIDEKMNAWYYK